MDVMVDAAVKMKIASAIQMSKTSANLGGLAIEEVT